MEGFRIVCEVDIVELSGLEARQQANGGPTTVTTPQTTEYRMIQLTQGQWAIVDDDRFEELNAFKWRAYWNADTRSFYAVRHSPMVNGDRHTIWMHRQILGLDYLDPRKGDHKEPSQTLDNRISNLRLSNDFQQQWNTRKKKNNTSGFKCVMRQSHSDKWRIQLRIGGRRIYEHGFNSSETANERVCELRAQYHGEFARTA